MKQIIYKSNLRPNRMPEWLRRILTVTLGGFKNYDFKGYNIEFWMLKHAIDSELTTSKARAIVTTEIVVGEENTVLFIKLSGRVLVSIYIK